MIRLSAPAHCLHLRMGLLEEITDIDVKWGVTVLGNYDHKLLLSLITSDSGHSGSGLTPAPSAALDRSHPRLVGQGRSRARGNTDTCGRDETRAVLCIYDCSLFRCIFGSDKSSKKLTSFVRSYVYPLQTFRAPNLYHSGLDLWESSRGLQGIFKGPQVLRWMGLVWCYFCCSHFGERAIFNRQMI